MARSTRGPGHYDELKDAHVEAELEDEPSLLEQDTSARDVAAHAVDDQRKLEDPYSAEAIEARWAAKNDELQEQLRTGRIDRAEVTYRTRQFDSELVAEMRQFDARQTRDSGEQVEPAPAQRDEQADRSQSASATEQKAAALEYEITKGGEMTEAKQSRFDRLLEASEGYDDDLDLSHDLDGPERGGRSRGR